MANNLALSRHRHEVEQRGSQGPDARIDAYFRASKLATFQDAAQAADALTNAAHILACAADGKGPLISNGELEALACAASWATHFLRQQAAAGLDRRLMSGAVANAVDRFAVLKDPRK